MTVEIRGVLDNLLSHHPTRTNLRAFASHAHANALAYLRTRARRGNLNPAFFGLSLEDLALDAIAPLFERDDRGAFVVLRDYYENIDWRRLSEHRLQSATRRLVFGRVNEAIFETYREFDPALSRIIRNLKKWIGCSEALDLSRIAGRMWVLHEATAELNHLPLAPEEYLESHLIPVVADEETTDQIVAALEVLLSYGSVYRGAYPLTPLARIVKSCYARLHQLKEVHHPTADRRLTYAETRALITDSVEEVKRRMRSTYVEKGKLDEERFALYFEAIGERLTAEYVALDGHGYTNYKVLSGRMPALSPEEYRKDHRPVFEYLSKLARDHVKETLRGVHSTPDTS